ncbi:tropomyosin-like isoform X2 [Sycon ciliatum]|uniref:tropomyosin-like isoform X2 n=1 Tax=Sycon ciliatum TaxID=27933 RepID=UPI0031F6952A|eukprot:scpid46312/ scgid4306/ 
MDSIRRSSYRLKALSTGHKELQLVISEQKSARVEYKNAIKVNKSATDQLLKWSQTEESEALQVSIQALAELNLAWCDVQRDLADQLKVANTTFERILEEEKELDKARKALEKSQQKEKTMQKEVDRIHKKGEDPGFAERKLEQAMRSKEIAESEVQGRYQETEANKQNMVREGLVCVAQAHLSMARKCSTLFEAYESICQTIPTRSERDSEPPPFTDSSKVASVCQSAIRMADRAQVVRSASYAIGEDLTGSLPPDEPLPPPPGSYMPPSYEEVDGFTRSAPGSLRIGESRPRGRSSVEDDGWASDEFDD